MKRTKPPRHTDPAELHCQFWERLAELNEKLLAKGLPFDMFECYRSPARQRYLYSKGRWGPFKTKRIVTRARPWWSFHQYGLATDLVLKDPDWTWRAGPEWAEMHRLARACGLRTLLHESPHVQLPGITIHQLRRGEYPDGGGIVWTTNLTEMIASYPKHAPPPPPPLEVDPVERPYLGELAVT